MYFRQSFSHCSLVMESLTGLLKEWFLRLPCRALGVEVGELGEGSWEARDPRALAPASFPAHVLFFFFFNSFVEV